MQVSIKIAIASHLSDAQFEMSTGNPELLKKANDRLNFVKYLTDVYFDQKMVTRAELDKAWETVMNFKKRNT